MQQGVRVGEPTGRRTAHTQMCGRRAHAEIGSPWIRKGEEWKARRGWGTLGGDFRAKEIASHGHRAVRALQRLWRAEA